MLTAVEFVEQWPEFAPVDAAVEAAVAEAELRTDASVFGALTNRAHGYLTAHILASGPSGKEARIKGAAAVTMGRTLYLNEREKLEDLVACQQIPPV